jgi:hypothetical protein
MNSLERWRDRGRLCSGKRFGSWEEKGKKRKRESGPEGEN